MSYTFKHFGFLAHHVSYNLLNFFCPPPLYMHGYGVLELRWKQNVSKLIVCIVVWFIMLFLTYFRRACISQTFVICIVICHA